MTHCKSFISCISMNRLTQLPSHITSVSQAAMAHRSSLWPCFCCLTTPQSYLPHCNQLALWNWYQHPISSCTLNVFQDPSVIRYAKPFDIFGYNRSFAYHWLVKRDCHKLHVENTWFVLTKTARRHDNRTSNALLWPPTLQKHTSTAPVYFLNNDSNRIFSEIATSPNF